MTAEWDPLLHSLRLESRAGSADADLPLGSCCHVLWFGRPIDIDLALLGFQLDPTGSPLCARRREIELLGFPGGLIQFIGAEPEHVALAAQRAVELLSPALCISLPADQIFDLNAAIRSALEAQELTASTPAPRSCATLPPRI